MQVCNPQEIHQAHSQYPPHSRVSLEKPLSLTRDYARLCVLNNETPQNSNTNYDTGDHYCTTSVLLPTEDEKKSSLDHFPCIYPIRGRIEIHR